MKLKYYPLHLVLQHARNKTKKKGPLLGKRFSIPRKPEKQVDVILYQPTAPIERLLPVLFNVHGGAWVGCDATYLDTQSQLLADRFGCFVVNINYTKLDVQPFPYPQNEVRDTVLYFKNHAVEYGLDREKFTLIGYSAGGHICAGAAMLLRDAGFSLNSQFLCYPFLDFSAFYEENKSEQAKEMRQAGEMMDKLFFSKMDKTVPLLSPAAASLDVLKKLAPTEIITCGEDMLFSHAVRYEQKLFEAGVKVVRKDVEGAVHGFLEVNFPETKENGAKNPVQEKLMQETVKYIGERAREHWKKDGLKI